MAEKENGEDAPPTFITSYLKEMERAKTLGKNTTLCKEQLRVNLQQMFIAGTDTTATTLSWFMVYMLIYPDIQKKMYEEICRVTGPDRLPDMQDKISLPYTSAVIMESQRLGSIAPQR
ncbi:cytochrome P450 [Elysia marginata]|uniref:Cytochrome P450 n=1 Tax=Elysia marginata TaxID=1093978 RepID=A0AAV4HTN1_9GAST|nr:cytochrome P450 [Elysia marginata]